MEQLKVLKKTPGLEFVNIKFSGTANCKNFSSENIKLGDFGLFGVGIDYNKKGTIYFYHILLILSII